MSDEFDDVIEPAIVRRVTSLEDAGGPVHDRSRPARLVARLYASAGASMRPRMLACLLRPLGPLALVAVASGAFAGLVQRLGSRGAAVSLDDLGSFSNDQIGDLAHFVEQVSPDALLQFAGSLIDSPAMLSAFSASAVLLLLRTLQGAGAGAPSQAQAPENATPMGPPR